MQVKLTTLEYFNGIKVFGKACPHPFANYAYYIKFRYKKDKGDDFLRAFHKFYPYEFSKLRVYITRTKIGRAHV